MCPINDSLASPSNDSDLFGAGPPLGSSFTVTSFSRKWLCRLFFAHSEYEKLPPPCDFSLMAWFDTEAGWLRVDLNWRKTLKIVINKRGPAVMRTRQTQIKANILANRMWESDWASPRARRCGSWSLPKRRIVRFTYASICENLLPSRTNQLHGYVLRCAWSVHLWVLRSFVTVQLIDISREHDFIDNSDGN